jgi:peptidyl-prolyl cis-trans isomerase A (cyclophilin A)
MNVLLWSLFHPAFCSFAFVVTVASLSFLVVGNIRGKKLKRAFLVSALAAGFASCSIMPAIAQQTTTPADGSASLTGPLAVMDTSMGRITCQLFKAEAPKTVAHFVGLAEGTEGWSNSPTGQKYHNKPLYNGTVFHRVVPGYMIQGGDPTGTGKGGPGFRFKDEIDSNLSFDRAGRLAMANSGPNTNGSQFFITLGPAEPLNGHHTIFGQCDQISLFVVRAIAGVKRDSNDKPLAPVVLKKITIVNEGQPMPPAPH